MGECPQCGYQNAEATGRCPKCGTALQAVCPACGRPVPSGSQFCNHCGAPLAVRQEAGDSRLEQALRALMPGSLARKVDAASAEILGERREVTVLSWGIADYSALTQTLDSETLYLLTDRAARTLAAVIYEYEGIIDTHTGDRLIALFGLPLAHENDPERAVRAALDINAALEPLKDEGQARYGLCFETQIGIHTGLVIAGQVTADLEASYTVTGDTVALAARLQGSAKPGTIAVGFETYQRTRPWFRYQTLPSVAAGDRSLTARAFRPLGSRDHPERLRGVPGLQVPMIGRQSALALLEETLDGVCQRQRSQVVLITGEAGVGKSRLLAEFRGTAARLGVQFYQGNSLTYARSRPLRVIASIIRDMLDIVESDPPWTQREALRSWMEQLDLAGRDVLPYLYHMLGLEQDEPKMQARLRHLEDDVLQKLTHSALQQVFLNHAQMGPMVIAFEDLHWVDPASRESLAHLVQTIDHVPVMMILVSRQAERDTVIRPLIAAAERRDQPPMDIQLSPLPEPDCERLVDRLVPSTSGEAEALKRFIVRRVGGNPFCAEEVVRMLIDQGALICREETWHVTPGARALAKDVPGTLRGLIIARMDSLPEGSKRTLQKAAVLGHTFPIALLQALVGVDAAELGADLEILKAREFLVANAYGLEEGCAFRHALIQEALYSTLLRRDRQRFHEQAAETIERSGFYPVEERTEALAYHYVESARPVRAIPYLVTAAENASRRCAYETAISYYRQALALMEEAHLDRQESVLYAQIGLGRALGFVGEYTEASQVMERALSSLLPLSIKSGSSIVLPILVHGMIELANVRQREGAPDRAIECLEAGLAATGANGAQEHPQLWRALIERSAWVRFRQGRLDEAFSLASSATLGLDPENQDDPITLANLYNTLGGILWHQGNLAEAVVYVERSLSLYDAMGYLWGMANAYTNLGILHYGQGNWPAAAVSLEEAEVLQRQIGDQQGRAVILNNLGTLRQSMGEHQAARQELAASLAIRERLGDTWGVAQAQVALARLSLVEGRPEEAIANVNAALAVSEDLGAYEIEARWILALAQAEGDLEAALASAERALHMARDAGLTEQEADCRRALGVLRGRAGDHVEAESLLRESVDLCVQADAPYGEGLALLELGLLYERMASTVAQGDAGWHDRALHTLLQAAERFTRLGAAHDLGLAQAAIARLEDTEASDPDRQAAPRAAEPALSLQFDAGLPVGEWRTATIVWLGLDPQPGADEEMVFEALLLAMPPLMAIAQESHGQAIRRQDGLMVVFGAPTAYEDDAERAVRTSWRMLEQLAKVAQVADNLVTRAAVSQGHIVAGPGSPGLHAELSVTGAAVREAEALGALTPPGRVWVTDAVRAATERMGLYEPISTEATTEAIGQPLWALTGFAEHPAPARGLPGIRARLIGRETPFEAMVGLARNLDRDIGGLIWIEGEPGIGKSRLMHEFAGANAIQRKVLWRGRCSPQKSGTAFSLFSDLLAQAFGIQPGDTQEQVRGRIEQALKGWPRDAQVTRPYLELLLGLQPSGLSGQRLLSLEPEQLRQQCFVSLRRLFKSLANTEPLIVLLDDLHWIDPISAEMMQFLLTMVASAPILFICAQRRQGADSPNDRLVRIQSLIPTQTVYLRLERLSSADSETLLSELLPGAELPDVLRKLIRERSEGNPYFIEEFVRMLVEQGHLQYRDGRWEAPADLLLDQVALPSSLEMLIRSRLDALPAELKEIVQCAAVIGTPFEAYLLEMVSEQPNVREALSRLESRLIVQRGAEADRWTFTHSLIENVAYKSLLKARRRQWHLRAAHALEKRWAGAEADHAETLAYHYQRGDDGRKALLYLMLAGERAAARYANEEAMGYLEQAAQRISEQPEASDSIRWRLAAGLGEVYRSMGKYADSMVALKAGLALMSTSEFPPLRWASLYRRLGNTARKQGELDLAHEHYAKSLQCLGEPADREMQVEASRCLTGLAWVHFLQGRFEQALEACEQSLARARDAGALSELAAAENLLGGIYWRQGDLASALHHTRRAMVLREQMGYTWGVASILGNLGILTYQAGTWNKAKSFFERSLTLRQEVGDIEGMVIIHNSLGIVARDQGEYDVAEGHFRQSLAIAEPFQMGYHVGNLRIGLSQTLLLKGEIPLAEETIQTAMDQVEAIGADDLRAEVHCVQAEVLLAQSEFDQAYAVAERAAAVVADIGNRALEASIWRVISTIELERGNVGAARRAIERAQDTLPEATDELEAGRIAAQAGRVDLSESRTAEGEAHLRVAHEVFMRLGAGPDLKRVERIRRRRTAQGAATDVPAPDPSAARFSKG